MSETFNWRGIGTLVIEMERNNPGQQPPGPRNPCRGECGGGSMIKNTIWTLRTAVGLSQAGLAERAGLAEETVFRVERGLEARPETFARLHDALSAAVDEAKVRLADAEQLLKTA
jgi:DNA-binding XRE family transcriptional regulator